MTIMVRIEYSAELVDLPDPELVRLPEEQPEHGVQLVRVQHRSKQTEQHFRQRAPFLGI